MNLEKLNEIMEQIKYGWIDINNELHENTMEDFEKLYRVSSAKETLENKMGSCIDQVELERTLLEKHYNVFSYALITNRMLHTFLIIEYNDNYVYYEHSSFKNKGIYYYKSLEDALENALIMFMKTHKITSKDKIKLINYEKFEPLTTFEEVKEKLL